MMAMPPFPRPARFNFSVCMDGLMCVLFALISLGGLYYLLAQYGLLGPLWDWLQHP